MKRKLKIHVHPAGQLGNQLFQLAAATYLFDLIEKQGIKQPAIIWHADKSVTRDLMWITGIKFTTREHKFVTKLLTSQVSLAERKKIVQITFSAWQKAQNFRKYHVRDLLSDLDFNLLSSHTNILISGYYQDFKWTAVLADSIRSNLTKKVSKEILSNIERDAPIAIHMRFGDYLEPNIKKVLGEVPSEYYRDAIEYFSGDLTGETLWVFTDDQALARKKLEELRITNFLFVDSFKLGAREELVLFALCPKKVISNSTYSWWGAYSSDPRCEVVAPSPLTNEHRIHPATSPAWIKKTLTFNI